MGQKYLQLQDKLINSTQHQQPSFIDTEYVDERVLFQFFFEAL